MAKDIACIILPPECTLLWRRFTVSDAPSVIETRLSVSDRANRLAAALPGRSDSPFCMLPANNSDRADHGAHFDFTDFVGQFCDFRDGAKECRDIRRAGQGYGTLAVLQGTTFCNIDCSYCYLPGRSQNNRMAPDVMRAAFDTVLASSLVADPVVFLWHLGEPLAALPQFYEDAFILAAKTADRYGRTIRHAFQTNATMLNDAWVDLIKRNDIILGVSVDGPAFIHDRVRITRRGSGTHAAVMRGVARLQEAGVQFGTISVLTDFTLDYPEEFYDFFVTNGIRSIAFNIDEVEGVNRHSSLESPASVVRYKRFLTRILERFEYHRGAVKIREVRENMAAIVSGMPDPVNSTSHPFSIVNIDYLGNISTFSPELVTARMADGRDFAMGNVLTGSLEEMLESPVFQEASSEIATGLQQCRDSCDYWAFCGGGSPSNKFFEHGRFDVTETRNCQVHKKGTVDVLMQYLERRAGVSISESSKEA